MTSSNLYRVLAATTALTLAACGDSVTAPIAELPAAPAGTLNAQADRDVAATAGASIAGAIVTLASNEAAAGIRVPGMNLIPGNLLREGSGGGTAGSPVPGGTETTNFGDRTETKSVSRSFTFFNAAGNVMSSFVHGTTASVRFLMTVDWRLTKDSTYVAASHSRSDHTLSGLLGDRRIWNGTAASADTTSHRDATSLRTYTGTAADTTTGVTFLADRKVNKYPLSGTSIRVVNYVKTITGRETATMTVARRVVVTYNGTNTAVMRIGTVTCALNLDTHKAENCS